MKKSETNSKNTVSKPEKGLKHLRFAGVGRKYIEERLAEMQKKSAQFEIKNKTNGRPAKKLAGNLESKS